MHARFVEQRCVLEQLALAGLKHVQLGRLIEDAECERGHILLVLEGQLDTELQDGRRVTLLPGMSYEVSNGASSHRSATATGGAICT